MPPLYKVHDKRRFLHSALLHLAGSAFISFEGDLAATKLKHVSGASSEETSALKRNTLWPRQDFVVLPLETVSLNDIITAIGGTFPRAILHVQIEKDGILELGLYDNFHPEAMFFGPAMTSHLHSLETEGLLSCWIKRA